MSKLSILLSILFDSSETSIKVLPEYSKKLFLESPQL